MAKYSVQAPNGKVYVLEGPDGASPEDVMKAAQGLAQAHEQRAAADYAKFAAEVNPTNDMGSIQRWLAGTGKGMTDLARGAGERLGLVSPEDIAQSRSEDAPLMATTAGKVGNITGKIAPALPAMFIPGANTLVGSTLIGATQGALEPTTADESVLKNIALGGVGGAAGYGAGKVVGAGVRSVRAAAEPFFAAGQQRIAGRALNTAAGDAAPQVAERLAEAAKPFAGPSQPGLERATLGELVPGSAPTVGQAAQNPGVAALERAATATTPDVTNQISAMLGGQNSARVNLLERLAGAGGERDFAAASRDATAEQLYGAARAGGVNPAALSPEAQANIAAMQARIPPAILNEAKQLAQIQGMAMDDTSSVAGLHYVKMALDDAIGAAKASGNATKARALTGLQQDFLSGLDKLSPDYAAARATYAEMSKPVNQMDIAQSLLDKSVSPLTGTLSPDKFARALTDKTAASATGFKGATLEGTLDNQQQNLLQSILADVQRSNSAQNAGRGVGSDTVQKLAYSNILDSSGLPTFIRELKPAQVAGNVLARGADAAYGRANKELAGKLAQTMLSPSDASQAMTAAAQYDEPNALLQLLAPYVLRLQGAGASSALLAGKR